jgi:tetratricopeptide (TPR) repeat protein
MPCRRSLVVVAVLVLAATRLRAQAGQAAACAGHSDFAALADRGWVALHASRIAEAESLFRVALRSCPRDANVLVGAGYAALRGNQLEEAGSDFERALASHPADYDALTGLGMLAYRRGDMSASRRRFESALALVPGDSLSIWYLEHIPGALESTRLALPMRPARTVVAARTGDRIFEVPDDRGGWKPLWIKAVNLGAALPGKNPSEFPADDSTYERWIEIAARMNANALRVYTIHPPHFYRALARWNAAHPAQPLWLIHGVWTELPPGKKEERYDDPKWKADFLAEMQRVVDVVHGHAVVPRQRGHASGFYTADVSRWTLAYIIGREWEPYSVVAFARQHRSRTAFAGRYLTIRGGNAVDAWLAEMEDAIIGYEMDTYNSQRPLAYTNWPTLDPLAHPTESTLAQEDSIRRVRHEIVPEMPKEYDNDAIGLDAALVRPTEAYPSGVFASFHAYPYYPDFIAVDSGYRAAMSPDGGSSYFGYLRDLVRHFGSMPVVISEYGVPSSRGIAHLQPQGWHHGGHSESEQAAINARLTRDIYAAGAAGAGLFSLIDEWFKKNWLVIDFERPPERNRLWLNVLDPEQNYGVVAMRPGRKDSLIVIDGRADDWAGRPSLYADSAASSLPQPLQLRSLSVTSDEAFVYLKLDVAAIDWRHGAYLIGIDTHAPALGDAILPITRSRSPVGLEFVIDLHGPEGSHLLVDHPYNPYRDKPILGSRPFSVQQVYNPPFRSFSNSAGVYDSLIVVTNRRRMGRDGTVYPAQRIDRGRLLFARQTETTLADWYADTLTGVIELRIAWGLLNVLDPSSRLVLRGDPSTGEIAGTRTDGFRFVVQSYDPANTWALGDRLPRGREPGTFGTVKTWTWPTWEEPHWYPEIKPQFEAMRRTFGAIPDRPASVTTADRPVPPLRAAGGP